MFKIVVLALFILGSSLAMADKQESVEKYEVLVNGKSIDYKVVSVEGDSFTLSNGQVKKGSGNILVSFKEEPNIASFESKYGVKFVKKSVLWSVFKNTSSKNLLQVSQEILEGEGDKVSTVTPDWIMDVKTR
ncbi:MAG: hypothetical protein ACLFQJ_09510 [Campylobacterales bacterium]